jgi:hypothetical protein
MLSTLPVERVLHPPVRCQSTALMAAAKAAWDLGGLKLHHDLLLTQLKPPESRAAWERSAPAPLQLA